MAVPTSFRRLMVDKTTNDFRAACSIHTVDTPALKDTELLLKNRYVGINASDINYTAGRYFRDSSMQPPFPVGFEGVGEVVQKGSKAQLPLGQAVAYMSHGAFSEYIVVDEKMAIPLPSAEKEYITLLVSGLTAGLALEKVGEMKEGETVVVTAAAGGTGQFAVQLAKIAGCHVIGTCSTPGKAQLLKELGCDRVVNYNEERLGEVLSKEYPNGVDVVYECIGGAMFDDCLNNIAEHGRLVVIGMISSYQSETGFAHSEAFLTLPKKLLIKNASVRGFLLTAYRNNIKPMATKLFSLYASKKLRCVVDMGDNSDKGPFKGIEKIFDAEDYLYSKKSAGKIVVEI